jgi:hypothetical protein
MTDDDQTWATTEFGMVDLGDGRRTARLIQLATQLGAQPTASLPTATADPAALKAAYRFFDNDLVDPQAILAGHLHATMARVAALPVVLAVQDTCYLDWTAHPATTGLGPLTTSTQQGLLMHSTLALTPDRVPVGLIQQQVWARDPATFAQHADHKQRPISEKESQKWLTSLDAVIALHAQCPTTQLISIGDREADVYDLFLVDRPPGVDLLIRAAWNRKVDHAEQYLWASMATVAVTASVTIPVGRRGGQPARTATLDIRWQAITLRPPKSRVKERLPACRLWAIWAVEASPPAGGDPIEWLLLTSVPIASPAAAVERLDWYACRWGIEVWHKILKSGCQIEAKQLATATRLQRCLSVYSVIAWRIQYATMLARAVPEAPCTLLLAADEWAALYCRIQRTTILPATPPTLRTVVRWIAQLGGFQGRTGDGEPGVTVLWKGLQQLPAMTEMYRIFRPPTPETNGSV